MAFLRKVTCKDSHFMCFCHSVPPPRLKFNLISMSPICRPLFFLYYYIYISFDIFVDHLICLCHSVPPPLLKFNLISMDPIGLFSRSLFYLHNYITISFDIFVDLQRSAIL